MPLSTLARKLQLKSDRALVVNAPPGYVDRPGVATGPGAAGQPDANLDFVQVFVRNSEELEELIPAAIKALKRDGLLWISYPKGTSGVSTDLNRDILWAAMKKYRLSGVAMVSIDDVWSAMRFRPTEKVGK